jgi:hypothetical protein
VDWNILIKVARLQLADRASLTALPWGVLAIAFTVCLAVAGSLSGYHAQIPTGGVVSIFLVFLVMGVLSVTHSLPFALALGVSRRSYYAGTALLAAGLAVVNGLALAVLGLIEGASSGWGVGLRFFRVAYILPGPWYLTWLTSAVVLALMFIYGMWVGLVHRRWDWPGLLAFGAAQAVVVVAMVIATSRAGAWSAVGRFFTTLGGPGLTGLLAALAVVLLVGGYATMRRVTV